MGSGACFISFTRLTPNFVQFEISDFGFELQDLSILQFPDSLQKIKTRGQSTRGLSRLSERRSSFSPLTPCENETFLVRSGRSRKPV